MELIGSFFLGSGLVAGALGEFAKVLPAGGNASLPVPEIVGSWVSMVGSELESPSVELPSETSSSIASRLPSLETHSFSSGGNSASGSLSALNAAVAHS